LDEVNGKYTESYAIPLMRGGKVAAVLTVDQELKSSVSQKLLESLGSLGFGAGGVSSIDLDGRVTQSWNPALIGRQIIPRDALKGLPTGRAVIIKGPAGDVTLAARVSTPRLAHGRIVVFQQPASVFYGDLRSGQRLRDIALFAVVAVAIGLLGAGRWRREQLLHRSEQRLDALLRYAHDIVIVTTGNTTGTDTNTTTFISSAITTLLGHHPTGWLNQPLTALVHRDDRPRLTRYTNATINGTTPDTTDTGTETSTGGGTSSGGSASTLHDVRLLAADGTYRWFDLHATDLTSHPEVTGIIYTCHEVGERKTLQDELTHRAHHDTLTGLPNRAVFTQHLETLNYANHDKPPAYTVLFIDLDRFKPVNDTFGHDAGDAVLRTVAHRLAQSTAQSTAQNPGSLVCRLGGDEFAVIIPGTDPTIATHLANDILHTVRQPIIIRGTTGQAVRIGATIGIAHARRTDDPATVVKRADQAMYQAKDSGRGRYVVHAG
jgi:diguanylate cyclase (GGDEF)-like protein